MLSNIDILLMTDNSLDTIGGAEESTKIIIEGIKKRFRTGVIQPGEIMQPVSQVHYYPLIKEKRLKNIIKQPRLFMKYIFKVRNVIIRDKPKVIHTQAQLSFFIVSLLKKMKLIPRDITLIHTERGLYTKYNEIIKQFFFFFIKELDVLVTTTNFNLNHWKCALSKRSINPIFKNIENTAGELFETYKPESKKGNHDGIIVGFAGRYADWKNWPLAIAISEKLNEKIGDKLQIHMALGCLDEQSKIQTEKMFKNMKELIGNRFKGQINISLEEMNNFYYDLDFYILTSNYNTESFGRTLVEAMSRHTVTLTTNSGGSVEVVGDKVNVCNTSEEFVERIMHFYYNKQILLYEKKKNMNRVKEIYSLENNHNKHLDLYESYS